MAKQVHDILSHYNNLTPGISRQNRDHFPANTLIPLLLLNLLGASILALRGIGA